MCRCLCREIRTLEENIVFYVTLADCWFDSVRCLLYTYRSVSIGIETSAITINAFLRK